MNGERGERGKEELGIVVKGENKNGAQRKESEAELWPPVSTTLSLR